MTTLGANTPRSFDLGDVNDLPVIASDIIFEGSAVGENGSGFSRPLQAGDPFQGFALNKADNSSGSAGDIKVRLQSRGKVELSVTGATGITANDFPPVYAVDDNDFTLTASTNTLIGNVHRWISSGLAIVSFDAPRPPSTVGTADIETNAITNAKIADNAVSLEQLDSGITMSHILVFAGEFTTAGGDATETINAVGIAATDIVHVTLHTKGGSPVTILTAVAITDNITVTMSADPSTDHVLSYSVFRAAA